MFGECSYFQMNEALTMFMRIAGMFMLIVAYRALRCLNAFCHMSNLIQLY